MDANLAPRTCRALCGLLCRVVEPAPEEADDERVAMVARETWLQRDAVAALRAVLAHTRDIRVDARGDETVEAHALRRCYAAFARDVAGQGQGARGAAGRRGRRRDCSATRRGRRRDSAATAIGRR